jgi:quinoprotein glucose dehydrogenase
MVVEGGHRGTIGAPGLGGGANWQSGAADPETGFVYVGSTTSPGVFGMAKNNPEVTKVDADYVLQGGLPTVQGLRILKPPYGRITAYDMNKGEIAWQIAHGETPDNIKNHPALKGLDIPRTGRPGGAGGSSGGIGTLVTKTLVISGEGGTVRMPDGSRGAMLRAYDKKTGAELGAVAMPGAQTGSPMTYMVGGKQYIVVANSSSIKAGELTAYKLP